MMYCIMDSFQGTKYQNYNKRKRIRVDYNNGGKLLTNHNEPVQPTEHTGHHMSTSVQPIRGEDAIKWKRRLSIAYGLCAWHAFGFVAYAIATGRSDWAHYYGFKSDEEKAIPPGRAWAAALGIPNAKVYRISGMHKVDEYDIVEGEEVRGKDVKDTISEEMLTE